MLSTVFPSFGSALLSFPFLPSPPQAALTPTI